MRNTHNAIRNMRHYKNALPIARRIFLCYITGDDFADFAGLQALGAYTDSLRFTVYECPNPLQIRQESAFGFACYLLACAAFSFGHTASRYGAAGNRAFVANCAYS